MMQGVEVLVRRGDGQSFAAMATTTAPAEAVWQALAHVSEHLEWGGRRQSRHSRLVSIDGPDREVSVGDTFTSTGVEMGGRWTDRSHIVEAEPGRLLMFETEGVLQPPRGQSISSSWRHRYEIERLDGGGSRVRYTTTRLRADPPPLLVRIPPLEPLVFRAAMRAALTGLRALASAAEQFVTR